MDGYEKAKERRKGLWIVLAISLMGMGWECARGYDLLKGPQERKRIEYWFNPFTCPDWLREDLHWAAEMWNFYGADIHYKRDTAISMESNEGYNIVTCVDLEDRGKSWSVAGTTYYWWDENGQITDADIFLDTSWMHSRSMTYVHEFGHMLGLGHSDFPNAAMTPGAGVLEYLSADDIAGLAKLYDIPANCTPYATDDLTVYFPHINGHWAELKAVDVENGEFRFILSDAGRSPVSAWECDLVYDTTEVRTSVYYAGTTFYAVLVREGQEWVLKQGRRQE